MISGQFVNGSGDKWSVLDRLFKGPSGSVLDC